MSCDLSDVSLHFLLASFVIVALFAPLLSAAPAPAAHDTVMRSLLLSGSYRFDKNGWSFVHLEGTPEQVGYQHGYLLAREIFDVYHVLKLEDTHSTGRDWKFLSRSRPHHPLAAS